MEQDRAMIVSSIGRRLEVKIDFSQISPCDVARPFGGSISLESVTRGLAFSERVTGTSRATEIFWKYANYQLASFLWHCARFCDRYCFSSHGVSFLHPPAPYPGFQGRSRRSFNSNPIVSIRSNGRISLSALSRTTCHSELLSLFALMIR